MRISTFSFTSAADSWLSGHLFPQILAGWVHGQQQAFMSTLCAGPGGSGAAGAHDAPAAGRCGLRQDRCCLLGPAGSCWLWLPVRPHGSNRGGLLRQRWLRMAIACISFPAAEAGGALLLSKHEPLLVVTAGLQKRILAGQKLIAFALQLGCLQICQGCQLHALITCCRHVGPNCVPPTMASIHIVVERSCYNLRQITLPAKVHVLTGSG